MSSRLRIIIVKSGDQWMVHTDEEFAQFTTYLDNPAEVAGAIRYALEDDDRKVARDKPLGPCSTDDCERMAITELADGTPFCGDCYRDRLVEMVAKRA